MGSISINDQIQKPHATPTNHKTIQQALSCVKASAPMVFFTLQARATSDRSRQLRKQRGSYTSIGSHGINHSHGCPLTDKSTSAHSPLSTFNSLFFYSSRCGQFFLICRRARRQRSQSSILVTVRIDKHFKLYNEWSHRAVVEARKAFFCERWEATKAEENPKVCTSWGPSGVRNHVQV